MNEIEEELQNVNELDELSGILELLALEYVKKGMTYKQVCENVKKSMILASIKLGNEKKVAIALSTGIDRREINKDYHPHQYRNKLIYVIREIRKYKVLSKTKTIAIKGPKPSIQFYSKLMNGRITLPAIVEELAKKKIIKVISKNKALIHNTRISTVESDLEKFRLINKQTKRQFLTINHNHSTPEDRWLDYSLSSTRINKDNQMKLNKILREHFNIFRPKGISLFEEYESDVPDGTYDDYSFNLFINISEE